MDIIMENEFNPTDAGFAPIMNAENPNTEEPGVDKLLTKQTLKFNDAKKAFARAALSFLLLFLAFQVIGTLISGILTGIQLFAEISSGKITVDGLDVLLGQGENVDPGELGKTVSKVLNQLMTEISEMIMTWSVFGTALAMPIGILIERAVLKKISVAPIEKKKLSFSEYLFLLIVSLGLWGAGAILGNIPSLFGLASPLDEMMQTEGWTGLFSLIYTVIGAPLFEELACRKLLLDKLHVYGEVPAAFFSAIIFALLHSNSTQFVLAFTVGLAFAVVYMRTGNILYTMSFHAIINFTASIASIADLCGAGDELVEILDIGTFVLLGVLAVVGITIAIVKRNSPLLCLNRPDFVGCNRIVYRNPGFIIFFILTVLTVLEVDLITFIMNFIGAKSFSSAAITSVMQGDVIPEPKAFLAFIPTVLFFAIVFSVMKNVGKKNTANIEVRSDTVSKEPESL